MAQASIPEPAPAPEVVQEGEEPFIPAHRSLPELTPKAILLGIALAVVLGAANMYVGLKVGLTVAASIPAAVISMGILRRFKNSNILENNIVQTAASSGESAAAGLIFTLPALIVMGLWTDYEILPTMAITLIGGVLGVLFTVPLRRAFVVEAKLPYPEGVACAQVLESGERGGRGVAVLAGGILTGAVYNFMGLGLTLWEGTLEGAARIGNGVAYIGTSLSPILLAVGAIVGIRIGFIIALGSMIAWFALIPMFLNGIPGILPAYTVTTGGTTTTWAAAGLSPVDAAYSVWNEKIRIVGGGAMIVGGFYTLWRTKDSLMRAFRGRKGAATGMPGDVPKAVPRTEQDLDMRKVGISLLAMIVPIFGLYYYFTGNVIHAAVASVVMAVAGFFFTAVAGYMAGVVGSSNNPISGVTIVTLLLSSLLLLAMGASGTQGILGALGVGAVIATAGAIAGDTLQDLKAGQLVGATPWKQQTAQLVGVASIAIAAPFVLTLLLNAFGFASADNPTGLLAPQATLMANILNGIFGNNLEWGLLILGMILAVPFILLNIPVMAVAVGIYLPLSTTLPIFLGGALTWAVTRGSAGLKTDRRITNDIRLNTTTETDAEKKERLGRVGRTGVLFASGLIAGEAIMGILLAGLILFEATPVSRVLTGASAPLVLGLLGATAVAVFGSRFGRARGWVAGGVALVGLAGTIWAFMSGFTYTFAPGAAWPGFLLLIYVAVLIAYVAWRENFLAEES